MHEFVPEEVSGAERMMIYKVGGTHDVLVLRLRIVHLVLSLLVGYLSLPMITRTIRLGKD